MGLNPFPGNRPCRPCPDTHDDLVDKNLGQAYKTVRFVYDNWETLEKNYDLLIKLPEAIWTFDPDDYATALQGQKADAAIPSAEKGEANGVATLDATKKIPKAQLPDITAADVGAVDLVSDQTVGGYKTWTSQHSWKLSATGQITYGQPGGDSTGISLFYGPDSSRRRSDIRARAADILIGCANTNESQPTYYLSIAHGNVKPNVDGVMSLGLASNSWTNVFAKELTVTGDANAKQRSRTALGAVGNIGDEVVAGIKTFTAKPVFNVGARVADDQILDLGSGNAGLRGNGTGSLVLFSAGAGTTPGQVLIRPNGSTATNTQTVFGVDGSITFGGDPTAKTATRTSLGAVGATGDQSIDGLKTFVANNAIRSRAVAAGFWFESTAANTTYGFLVNTDGDRLNVNLRQPNFGAQIATLFQMTQDNFKFGAPLIPFSANTLTVGTATTPFLGVFANQMTFTGSDAQKTSTRTSLGAAAAPGAWTNVSALQNGFVNNSGSFSPAGYRTDGNFVYLRGVINSPSHPTTPTLFTLPTGLRPAARKVLKAIGSFTGIPYGVARVDVNTDGTVFLLQPSGATDTGFLSLDGLFFELT